METMSIHIGSDMESSIYKSGSITLYRFATKKPSGKIGVRVTIDDETGPALHIDASDLINAVKAICPLAST